MKKIKVIIKTLRGFFKRTRTDHISAYAAQSSYFLLLAFIPFILLLMTSVRYTPLTQNMILNAVVRVIPTEFQSFVKIIILEVYTKSLAVVPLTAIMTLWTAGKGIMGLTNGLNAIYQVEETRNYVSARMRAAIYTLIFIVCIVACLVLLVFGNSIQEALEIHVPFVSRITKIVLLMSPLFSLVVLALVFMLMYTFLPNRKAKMKRQFPGAGFSAVAWSLFSWFFSLYLEYFNVANMYGSLTTIIMIMLWMYFCMYIFLLGAEVNSYFEDKFRFFSLTALMFVLK